MCPFVSATSLLLFLLTTPSFTVSSSATVLRPNDFLVEGLEDIQPAFGEFNGTMYAGRMPTNNQDGKLMFWLYYTNTDTDSMVIWLNGGPGCSSFGGMLCENAPVTVPHYASGTPVTPLSPPLIANPFSWTRAAHMLYVEQPAGTGFSSGPLPKNETDVASDFYGFLSNFYHIFPSMKSKSLFIFGESYAGNMLHAYESHFVERLVTDTISLIEGMYVPSIARKICLENRKTQSDAKIPLAGIALGNGWIDATVQGPAVIDYAWWHGMIDLSTKNALHEQFRACIQDNIVQKPLHAFNTPDECGVMEAVQAAAGNGITSHHYGPNIYDVTTWDKYSFVFDRNGTFVQFFNSPRVQEILHAPKQYWQLCLPGEGRRRQLEEHMLEHDEPVSVVPYIAELLDDAEIRVLIYNGDRDMSCCAQGSEMLLNDMSWSGSKEWKTAKRGVWLVDDEPAGYARATKNLEFVVVYNSGHLMPMNQPKTALDLVSRMVNGIKFGDEELPAFKAPSGTKATEREGKSNGGQSFTDENKSASKQEPTPRRRLTGLLIIFSIAIGFVAGMFTTTYLQSKRRYEYESVPDVESQVEVSTSQYPWRWWTSHHGGVQRQ